jgi:hypothetical protein
MGMWEIHQTTLDCIIGISPLGEIRLRWEGYIKLYVKKISAKLRLRTGSRNRPLWTRFHKFRQFRDQQSHWAGLVSVVIRMLCYAMSERHSLAPGHRGQVESCGPVAEETDFTAPWKPTSLWYQQACSTADFGCILYGSSSETRGKNCILVQYIPTFIFLLSIPLSFQSI